MLVRILNGERELYPSRTLDCEKLILDLQAARTGLRIRDQSAIVPFNHDEALQGREVVPMRRQECGMLLGSATSQERRSRQSGDHRDRPEGQPHLSIIHQNVESSP
jgi:hypothetical protein